MADIKLFRGVTAPLTITQGIANGAAASSDAFGDGGADDSVAAPDEYSILADIDGLTAAEAANIYVAPGPSSGLTFDGPIAESSGVSDLDTLKNLIFIGSVIGNGGASATSRFVVRLTSSRAVVVVENTSTTAITAVTLSAQPTNYQSN